MTYPAVKDPVFCCCCSCCNKLLLEDKGYFLHLLNLLPWLAKRPSNGNKNPLIWLIVFPLFKILTFCQQPVWLMFLFFFRSLFWQSDFWNVISQHIEGYFTQHINKANSWSINNIPSHTLWLLYDNYSRRFAVR